MPQVQGRDRAGSESLGHGHDAGIDEAQIEVRVACIELGGARQIRLLTPLDRERALRQIGAKGPGDGLPEPRRDDVMDLGENRPRGEVGWRGSEIRECAAGMRGWGWRRGSSPDLCVKGGAELLGTSATLPEPPPVSRGGRGRGSAGHPRSW